MTPATRLMVEKLTALAEQGKSYAEAAWEIEGTYQYVARVAKQYGIPFKLERRRRKPQHQDAAREA